MSKLLAPLILMFAASAAAASPEQHATAGRFVGAMQGKADFASVGFVDEPSPEELTLYSRLQNCKVRHTKAPSVPHPEKRRTYVELPNELWLILACKGVSMRNPIIVELRFDKELVNGVTVINADRLKD